MSAGIVKGALRELQELLLAVDVPAAADKPDQPVDRLWLFMKDQAAQTSHEATRCAAVFGLPSVDVGSVEFVCTSLTGPTAKLVAAAQLLLRKCGREQSRQLRQCLRHIVMGCLGMLQQFLPASARNKTHAQAAGMLWRACDRVGTLPKSDVAAAKRVVLGCAKVAKDSHAEWLEDGEKSVQPFLPVLKGIVTLIKAVLGTLNAAPPASDADGDGSRVAWLDNVADHCRALEGCVVDFAAALDDVDSEGAAHMHDTCSALQAAVRLVVNAAAVEAPAGVPEPSRADVRKTDERLQAVFLRFSGGEGDRVGTGAGAGVGAAGGAAGRR